LPLAELPRDIRAAFAPTPGCQPLKKTNNYFREGCVPSTERVTRTGAYAQEPTLQGSDPTYVYLTAFP
jgi:hypothetical protein